MNCTRIESDDYRPTEKKPDPYLICIYDDDDVAKQTNQTKPNQTTDHCWLIKWHKKNAVKREVVTLQLNIKRIQNWSKHTHTHHIYIKCNLEFFSFSFFWTQMSIMCLNGHVVYIYCMCQYDVFVMLWSFEIYTR